MKPSKQLFRSSDRARKSSTLKIGVGGLQILGLSPIRSGSPINSMKYVTLSKTHEDSIMKASKKLFCSTDEKKKSSKLKSGVGLLLCRVFVGLQGFLVSELLKNMSRRAGTVILRVPVRINSRNRHMKRKKLHLVVGITNSMAMQFL